MESTQCLECAHYLGAHACTAFPEKIPDAIFTGDHDHREPYPGDGGIRFKPLAGIDNGENDDTDEG